MISLVMAKREGNSIPAKGSMNIMVDVVFYLGSGDMDEMCLKLLGVASTNFAVKKLYNHFSRTCRIIQG